MSHYPTFPLYPSDGSMPCRGIVHVISPGDTLYRLSQKYHVSVSQLMYANPYTDIYNLIPGDELCIPISMARPEPPQPVPSSPSTSIPRESDENTRMQETGSDSAQEQMEG